MSVMTVISKEERIHLFKYAMDVLIEGCWGPLCNSDYAHHDCNKIHFSKFYLDYYKTIPVEIMNGFARLHIIQHSEHDVAELCNVFLQYDFPQFMEYFGSEMTRIMDEAKSDELQNLIYMGLNNEVCTFGSPHRDKIFNKEFDNGS